MISRIELTSYRCFDRLDLDLKSYEVIVGPNGSGKTTLLDIPALLSDLLRNGTASQNAFLEARDGSAPRASSLTEIVHKSVGDWFAITVELVLPDSIASQVALTTKRESTPRDRARYELRFRVGENAGLEIVSEHLILFPTKSAPARFPDPDSRRIFGDIPPARNWQISLNRELGSEVVLTPEVIGSGSLRKAISYLPANPSLLALAGIQFQDKSAFPAARWVYEFLTTSVLFLNPDWNLIRAECLPGFGKNPNGIFQLLPSARNAVWVAHSLLETDAELFSRWVSHVRLAIPQIENIEIRENPNNKALFFWVRYQGGFALPSSALSDGTLRVMILSLLAFMNNPPGLIICEEPENGIHPKAVDVVLEALRSVYGSQVLVSTHSPVVVAATDLDQMLAADNSGTQGARVLPAADHPRLQAWKHNRTPNLATLYATGVLG